MSRIDDINNSNLDGALKGILISDAINDMRRYTPPPPSTNTYSSGSSSSSSSSSSYSWGSGSSTTSSGMSDADAGAALGFFGICAGIFFLFQAAVWFLDNWVAATPVLLAFLTPCIAFWVKHEFEKAHLPFEIIPAINFGAVLYLSVPANSIYEAFLWFALVSTGTGAVLGFVQTVRTFFGSDKFFEKYDVSDVFRDAFSMGVSVVIWLVILAIIPGVFQLVANIFWEVPGFNRAMSEYWEAAFAFGLLGLPIIFFLSVYFMLSASKI